MCPGKDMSHQVQIAGGGIRLNAEHTVRKMSSRNLDKPSEMMYNMHPRSRRKL